MRIKSQQFLSHVMKSERKPVCELHVFTVMDKRGDSGALWDAYASQQSALVGILMQGYRCTRLDKKFQFQLDS